VREHKTLNTSVEGQALNAGPTRERDHLYWYTKLV
jgi:hypothetical protein